MKEKWQQQQTVSTDLGERVMSDLERDEIIGKMIEENEREYADALTKDGYDNGFSDGLLSGLYGFTAVYLIVTILWEVLNAN